MRFVSPETVRIDLELHGEAHWIEVKKELSVGEERRYRTSGFRGMRGQANAKDGEAHIDVDFAAMSLARVKAYLVDWSAKDDRGKDVKLSDSTIENLDQASFDAIDQAILAHIGDTPEGKKSTSTGALPA